MNAFRHRSAARSLLVLAVLVVLLHFISSLVPLRPANDRFDFSSAICTTASAGAVSVGATPAAEPGLPPQHQQHASHCACKLCCGGHALVLLAVGPPPPAVHTSTIDLPPAVVAVPVQLVRWAPHAARAPPAVS